jgi:hypothetical protein
MAEFSASPEARALARLKELHRAEQVPPDVRARVAERLARLPAPPPKSALLRRGSIGLLLLAAAAGVALELRSDRTRVTPLPEQPAALRTAELVSLSGTAVPGSLSWRGGGAADGNKQLDCQYVFSIQQESGAPIRVRWARCEFPRELRQRMQRRSSTQEAPLRVFVVGRWSAPGQLEATEVPVFSLGTEP